MTDSTTPYSTPFQYQWPRASRVPEDYDGRGKLTILLGDDGMTDAERKRHVAAWCAALPTMAVSELCVAACVTQPVFEAICAMPGLERLELKWSHIRKLDSIRALQNLRYLTIGSSTKVESIEPLAEMSMLVHLDIENFKLITDFSPLVRLHNLKDLAITGSMWSRQSVDSLEPIARMTWLKSLAIDTSAVETLRPLAALTELEWLGLNARQPMEEYAWLAGKLPHTACARFQAYEPYEFSQCSQGHGESMVMVVGKGGRVLCRHCDAAKLAALMAAFDAVRAMSAAEGQE